MTSIKRSPFGASLTAPLIVTRIIKARRSHLRSRPTLVCSRHGYRHHSYQSRGTFDGRKRLIEKGIRKPRRIKVSAFEHSVSSTVSPPNTPPEQHPEWDRGCPSSSGIVPPSQPIQSTAFNLSLDKYIVARYSLVKVLLTVSPFRPSLPQQPNVYPCSPKALSPLSTAFTQICRGVGYVGDSSAGCRRLTSNKSRVTSRSFSIVCALFNCLVYLFATSVFCFQQLAASFAKTPGVGVPPTNLLCVTRTAIP